VVPSSTTSEQTLRAGMRGLPGRRRRAPPAEPGDRDAPAHAARDGRDHGEYPDIDMVFLSGRYSGTGGYSRKDGTRY
jgi:hypothetical protein